MLLLDVQAMTDMMPEVVKWAEYQLIGPEYAGASALPASKHSRAIREEVLQRWNAVYSSLDKAGYHRAGGRSSTTGGSVQLASSETVGNLNGTTKSGNGNNISRVTGAGDNWSTGETAPNTRVAVISDTSERLNLETLRCFVDRVSEGSVSTDLTQVKTFFKGWVEPGEKGW